MKQILLEFASIWGLHSGTKKLHTSPNEQSVLLNSINKAYSN